MDHPPASPEIDMEEVGIDKYSYLPEPIIHQIMSLLPTEDSTRISTLSKSSLLSWRSFPILDFDFYLMESTSRAVFTMDMFLNLVIHSLERRALRSDLRRLRFRACLHHRQHNVAVVVRRMVNFAIENKRMSLSGLQLDFTNLVLSCPLIEEFSITDCSSKVGICMTVCSAKLKTAKFKNWIGLDTIHMDNAACLESFSYSGDTINEHFQIINLSSCKSLKILKLDGVSITDKWLENLLSQFFSLEILKLKLCKQLKNLRISMGHLKIMSFKDCTSLENVDVVAQNLEFFRYSKKLPFTGRRCNFNLSKCTNLKDLQLIGARLNVTPGWTEEEISTPGFSFLERLKIEGCKFLKTINFYAEHLKHLELRGCSTLQDTEIDAPNLVSFVYGGPVLTSSAIIFCKYQYAELHLYYLGLVNDYYRRLRDFVGKFGHYQTLTLVCNADSQLIFPFETREMFIARLFDLKHLNIVLKTPIKSMVDLIDGLLWLVPHSETISINMACKLHAKFKFYYNSTSKFEYDEDDTKMGCCRYGIKCWRHFLTRVEMEIFEKFDEWESLQSFFMKMAKAEITTSIDKIE
ncbi:hypothetical protein TIFTF001_026267 [Ficus carica]|uniref:At1g61320/AtMIF1 LRR domain-containing protein n=1 Tax=Ficus carica TaxID=3494 RepID=A0AA88IWP1_FICCA|nr:hypothetical protein TIFTF001_026267 [Ficus carica]